MVKLIGIIVGTVVVSAFLLVTFVFIDRFLFEKENLIGSEDGEVVQSDRQENISTGLSVAAKKFDMLKPIETRGVLSVQGSPNSLTRYLKSLKERRNATKAADIEKTKHNAHDLAIILKERISAAYLNGIREDLSLRGFNDIVIQHDSAITFFYGLKDESERSRIANILSDTYFLEPILGGFK